MLQIAKALFTVSIPMTRFYIWFARSTTYRGQHKATLAIVFDDFSFWKGTKLSLHRSFNFKYEPSDP